MAPRHPPVAGRLLAVLTVVLIAGCSSSRRSRSPEAGSPAPPGAPPDAPLAPRPPEDPPLPVSPCPFDTPLALDERTFGVRLMTGGAGAVLQRLTICDVAALDRNGRDCFPPPPVVYRGCEPPFPVDGVPALGPDGLLFASLVASDDTPWFSVRGYQAGRTVGWGTRDRALTEAYMDASDERRWPWMLRLPGGAMGVAPERSGPLRRWQDGASSTLLGSDVVVETHGGVGGLPSVFHVRRADDGEERLVVVDDAGIAHDLAAPIGAHQTVTATAGPWHCVEDLDGAGRFLRIDDASGEVGHAFDLPGRAPCRADLGAWLPDRDALLVVAGPGREGARGPLLLVRGEAAPTVLRDDFAGPVRTAGEGTIILAAEGDRRGPTSVALRVDLRTGTVDAVTDEVPAVIQLHARGDVLATTGLEGSTLVLATIAPGDDAFAVRRHLVEGAVATNLTLSASGVLWFEERATIPDGPFSLWSLGPSGALRHLTQPLPVGGPLPTGQELLLAARPTPGTTELVRLVGEEATPLDIPAGALGASNLMTWGDIASDGVDGAGYAWLLMDGRLGRYREGVWTPVLEESSTYALLGIPAPEVRIVERLLRPGMGHEVVRLSDGEAIVLARDVAFARTVSQDLGDRDGRRRRPWGWALAAPDGDGGVVVEACPFDPAGDGGCRRATWPEDIPMAEESAYLDAGVSRDGWVTVAIRTAPTGAGDQPGALVARFPPPGMVP